MTADDNSMHVLGPDGQWHVLGTLGEDGLVHEPEQLDWHESLYTKAKQQAQLEFTFQHVAGTNDAVMDLFWGSARERERADLLNRLNVRWRDHFDPGVPDKAREVLGGITGIERYVAVETKDRGRQFFAGRDFKVHDDTPGQYGVDMDLLPPHTDKTDPRYYLQNPRKRFQMPGPRLADLVRTHQFSHWKTLGWISETDIN